MEPSRGSREGREQAGEGRAAAEAEQTRRTAAWRGRLGRKIAPCSQPTSGSSGGFKSALALSWGLAVKALQSLRTVWGTGVEPMGTPRIPPRAGPGAQQAHVCFEKPYFESRQNSSSSRP